MREPTLIPTPIPFLETAARIASDVLGQMSFWFFVIGITLLLMRGMGPPGTRSIDKKKFHEVKREIEEKLKNGGRPLREKFLLYCGKYFFIYHYYRNDLIFYWFIGGALVLKFISVLMEEML